VLQWFCKQLEAIKTESYARGEKYNFLTKRRPKYD
jgi:hypothetical protein